MRRAIWACAAAVLILSGCTTTDGVDAQPASAQQAHTGYPGTGVESVAGEWSGTWKGLVGRSTLSVKAPSAEDIEVKYCFGNWCAGGCTKEPCGWYANPLSEIGFENEQLKFSSRGRPFVFERDGAGLRGTYKGKYEARMRRR